MSLHRHKEIGGYMEFDLNLLDQFPYKKSAKFNSARSALYEYVKVSNIKTIWMPKFICDTVLLPLEYLGINIKYYDLDQTLLPCLTGELENGEYLYYVNYFGICTENLYKLKDRYPFGRLIFDHAQAFFVPPIEGVTTIYSPRKFLPVADGGILVTKVTVTSCAEQYSDSFLIDQYKHLFTRYLSGAKLGYEQFQLNEKYFNENIPKAISPLTELIFKNLDYKKMRDQRIENFRYLHSKLGKLNKLIINLESVESPLTYPFLFDKQFTFDLIDNNVYSPTYWKDCLKRIDKNSFEYRLVNNMTHFICDHRYNIEDMDMQLELVKELFS